MIKITFLLHIINRLESRNPLEVFATNGAFVFEIRESSPGTCHTDCSVTARLAYRRYGSLQTQHTPPLCVVGFSWFV